MLPVCLSVLYVLDCELYLYCSLVSLNIPERKSWKALFRIALEFILVSLKQIALHRKRATAHNSWSIQRDRTEACSPPRSLTPLIRSLSLSFLQASSRCSSGKGYIVSIQNVVFCLRGPGFQHVSHDKSCCFFHLQQSILPLLHILSTYIRIFLFNPDCPRQTLM